MARNMETETRWEAADQRLHREQQLPAKAARQGRSGIRILMVLVVALVLAFIVWIPVELWGNHKAAPAATPPTTTTNQNVVGGEPVPTQK